VGRRETRVIDPIGSESVFPAEPVESRVFIEDVVPALFADLDLSPAQRAVELRLGIILQGESGGHPGGDSGGEWTLHFVDGELGIETFRRPDCDLTLVQRVADWRSALWSGQPPLVADALRVLFRAPGIDPASGFERSMLDPDPRALEELRRLSGLLEIRVEAADRERPGEGSEGWRLGLRLGPGPIPAEADATIELGAVQAEAIRQGRLHPLEALMTGELRLEGDLGLILQIQAIAMTASLPR
jgi:hypothetical protein